MTRRDRRKEKGWYQIENEEDVVQVAKGSSASIKVNVYNKQQRGRETTVKVS
jgi:hypothetical protein